MADRYTILLVDDEPDVRAAVRRALQLPGYTILEAGDGAAALELVKERTLDAIVTDFCMPGMDGLELLLRIKLMQPEVLRVLITSRADVNLAIRALNEGAAHRFFLKPWDRVDLRGILRTALHSRLGLEASNGA
jgi:DNA-binding NtrC family response regulator